MIFMRQGGCGNSGDGGGGGGDAGGRYHKSTIYATNGKSTSDETVITPVCYSVQDHLTVSFVFS